MLVAPQDILYFQTIAKTKNLRAAAEALHVTQPALSHSLKRLEAAFNEALFERTSMGLKLTARGARLLDESKLAMTSWQQLSDGDNGDNSSAQLRIGMHPSVATYFAGQLLGAGRKMYANLSLDLAHGLSRDVTRLVIDGELDAAIAINPVRSPGLVIRELLTDTVAVVATRQGSKSSHLIFDPSLAQSQWILKTLEKRGEKFASQSFSSNLEVIRSLAETGLACAILPMRVAALARVKLEPIFDDGPVYRDRLCFVCRPFFLRSKFGRDILEASKAAAHSI
jgi:DNA-binding transcriptional LysR family regulator